MKKSLTYFSLLFTIVFLIFSCSKVGGADDGGDLNEIDQSDDILPVISTQRPSANQVYVSGDSIIVEGKVTDDKKLYKGKVQIKNDATSSVIAEAFYETHFLSTISFRLAYKAVVTSSTDFTVLIDFQDHGANNVNQTIKVKVNL